MQLAVLLDQDEEVWARQLWRQAGQLAKASQISRRTQRNGGRSTVRRRLCGALGLAGVGSFARTLGLFAQECAGSPPGIGRPNPDDRKLPQRVSTKHELIAMHLTAAQLRKIDTACTPGTSARQIMPVTAFAAAAAAISCALVLFAQQRKRRRCLAQRRQRSRRPPMPACPQELCAQHMSVIAAALRHHPALRCKADLGQAWGAMHASLRMICEQKQRACVSSISWFTSVRQRQPSPASSRKTVTKWCCT